MQLLFKKKGFPEEGEIVLCKVLKVYHSSVFVELVEYNLQGIINISEVAPGRIRNLNDYVRVGKYVICKVLRVDKIKQHIDLSLRRVSEYEKRQKSNEIKQEQKAEKMLELVAKKHKKDHKQLFYEIMKQIEKDYYNLFDFFVNVFENNKLIDKIELDEKIKKDLVEIINTNIKPPKKELIAEITLRTYEGNGLELIKKALEIKDKDLEITYEGAGKYRLVYSSDDYKTGEKKLKKISEHIENFARKHNMIYNFKRIEA